jgi:hypothetical protein
VSGICGTAQASPVRPVGDVVGPLLDPA